MNEVFETLKQAGLLKSKAEFSVDWLERSERYYSMLDAAEREISVEALATLTARLENATQQMEERDSVEAIEALTRKLTAVLRDRVLVSKRQRSAA